MSEVVTENTIRVLDHGFVRLDDAMASDLSVVNGAANPQQGLEDVFWAILNSREFLFNH